MQACSLNVFQRFLERRILYITLSINKFIFSAVCSGVSRAGQQEWSAPEADNEKMYYLWKV